MRHEYEILKAVQTIKAECERQQNCSKCPLGVRNKGNDGDLFTCIVCPGSSYDKPVPLPQDWDTERMFEENTP